MSTFWTQDKTLQLMINENQCQNILLQIQLHQMQFIFTIFTCIMIIIVAHSIIFNTCPDIVLYYISAMPNIVPYYMSVT
jgi:hypothetical protein